MNKKRLISVACALLATSAFAEKQTVYISPNNDGVQDALEIPLKIKEKRYVKEWSFEIFDENGKVVRTIGNKEKLPEKMTAKSFYKALVSPKQAIEVPAVIVWNGYFDDGSLAPDGVYYYQFSATDDNGNSATTEKYKVIVDNTAPSVAVASMNQNAKSFGEGAKSTLKIKQNGSKEKLWVANFYDNDGNIVRTYSFNDSEPLEVSWDGLDNDGNILSDGVYSYEISSTDEAGNKSEKATVTNIIYSTEKPVVTIALKDTKFFAPEGNSSLKTMDFNVSIPAPTSKVNSLSSWKIDIMDKDLKTVYRSYEGTDKSPANILKFDGKDNNGKAIAEGEYRARVVAKYSNGFETEPLLSPVFVLDNHTPKAQVTLPANKVFNGKENFVINQTVILPEPEYTGEKQWTGKILNEEGKIVKQYDFGNSLSDVVAWNGIDDAGNLAKDGKYYYELSVSEKAGNTSVFGNKDDSNYVFTLDTSKTELVLAVGSEAFSPNGNGVQDTIALNPVVKASSGIQSYEINIYDIKKNLVKTFKGNGSVPATISWDGKNEMGIIVSDGKYTATIKTVANSGTVETASCLPFVLDTVAPEIAISNSYEFKAFSPDGISTKQNFPVKIEKSSVEAKWNYSVVNEKTGKVVKEFAVEKGKATDFTWDGTDNNGNLVENGSYTIEVSCNDGAGNTASDKISNITLDNRVPSVYITSEYDGISPNGDGYLDAQKFTVKLSLAEGVSNWSFDLINLDGKSVKHFDKNDSVDIPSTITWAGDTTEGTLANGIFIAQLHVEYAKGNVVDAYSSSFVCAANGPQLTCQTAPKYFSPDNDGNDDDLFIKLKGKTVAELKNWSFTIYDRNGNQFWKTSGKSSITERIIWDGRGNNGDVVESGEDYRYVFEATDTLGQTSKVEGIISVDVLVVKDGSKLKMQVPSIIFRSDNADFGVQVLDENGNVVKNGITQAQADNNERVLKRIAVILKKFGDYKVTIVGHANSVTGTEEEETTDNPKRWGPALKPLSEKRAQYVKDQLVKMGINENRLTVEGKGGSEPVADRNDKKVNWKNRRVEFILEK